MSELEKAQQELIALANEVGIQHPEFIALNEKVDQLVLVEQRRWYENWKKAKRNTTQPASSKSCFLV
ncbi:MAG: hypothetical protein ACYC3E_00820 [Carboxydocellales bacterium]